MQIWILDDHALFRAGLIQLLPLSFPQAQFIEFEKCSQLETALSTAQPDLLLLDLQMGDTEAMGLTVLEQIKPLNIRTIVLTMHDTAHYCKLCIERGAAGFLSKGAPSSMLVEVVEAILKGENRYWNSQTRQCETQSNHSTHRQGTLSEREQRICAALCAGLSLAQIADQLGISSSSVATYRNRLFQKLQVRSKTELIRQLKAESR